MNWLKKLFHRHTWVHTKGPKYLSDSMIGETWYRDNKIVCSKCGEERYYTSLANGVGCWPCTKRDAIV